MLFTLQHPTPYRPLVWAALGLVLGAGLGALAHAIHPVECGSYEQNRRFQVIIAALPGAMIGAQIPLWNHPRNVVRGARRGLFIAVTTVALTMATGALLGYATVVSEYLQLGVSLNGSRPRSQRVPGQRFSPGIFHHGVFMRHLPQPNA